MEENRGIDTRTTLLGRVKDSTDHSSWQTFHDIYAKLIYRQAIRAGLNQTDAEDLVQDILVEVVNRIKVFQYTRKEGSFKGWLFQLTQWRIANLRQKRCLDTVSLEEVTRGNSHSHDSLRHLQEIAFEPDENWEEELRQAMFSAALAELRKKFSPKHYQVIDLLFVKQKDVAEVKRSLRINRAQIYLIKYRAFHHLRRHSKRFKRGF